MDVLHANWSDGALMLWSERAERFTKTDGKPGGEPDTHPFAANETELRESIAPALPGEAREGSVRMLLPADGGKPRPSTRLAHALGYAAEPTDEDEVEGDVGVLREYVVPTLSIDPAHAGEVLERLIDLSTRRNGSPAPFSVSDSVRYFAAAVRFARYLMVQQRFVPMLSQRASGGLEGGWRPWVADDRVAERASSLVRAMPASARATIDRFGHEPWAIADDLVSHVVDAECRRVLLDEEMTDTIDGRDPATDPHVAWLGGLLGTGDKVEASEGQRPEMIKRVRRWIGGLEDRGSASQWRLRLRMNEPIDDGLMAQGIEATPESAMWSLSFHLEAADAENVIIDAADIWLLTSESLVVEGRRIESPQEILLAELGRASRICRSLESALDEAEPVDVALKTKDAYTFLRELRPLLIEQGFSVEAPVWWDSPAARLGARLRLSDPEGLGEDQAAGASDAAGPQLGLTTLVSYQWEIAIGDTTLTLHEFEQLASKKTPLVRVNGRWVEIRPEDVKAAVSFIGENPGGEMEVGEALRLAYLADQRETGLPIVGMEAEGWIAAVLGGDGGADSLPMINQPENFEGSLRPYQARGLSWMAFMERFGFGICLADDMGLGKTIQVLALLLHERKGERPNPTLLIVPTSVVGNWTHETKRFAPELKVLVHHGLERLQGDAFKAKMDDSDIVITTYALAHRDRELLGEIEWGRIVLDEAQYIKNPAAKQAQAARALNSGKRIALTGTPVENRLSELWSIMDFLNPGYLGTGGDFRKRFGIPIERYHDMSKAEQLRGLVRPFVLRRLKTDPKVVSDLPEKLEGKEYCHLTGEQASLYESCVKRMLTEVEQSDGIQRRGLVLSALVKLKQICNHPAQLLGDDDPQRSAIPSPARSGKCVRLVEMLDEVLAEGDQALIFTQFRKMGKLLASMLRHELDREVLFLHGGSTQKQRASMIEQFQKGDGRHPIFILSLKAGGVGLNLTAANHVFHFDRWWNPAVENQATDRAYRIGQSRTVMVHKYLVRGTLEERIDEMIESKTELAQNIIGSGEQWLTELSTDQLRDVLSLRGDAVGIEE